MKRLLLLFTICISSVSFGQTNTSSISFDGNTNYIDFGNPAELKIANEITYMAWVKTTQWTNASGIIGRGEGSSGAARTASFLMILSSTPGQIRWEISDGTLADNLYSNTNLSLDSWNHIAVTWDGTNSSTSMKIYVDGILDASGGSSISSINQNITATEDDKFKIGLRDVFNSGQLYGHHNGFIDEVSAWNIALTEQEIQDYKNCPPVGTEIGLVGYWNFEPHDDDEVEYGAECFDGIDNDFDDQVDLSDGDCQTIIELDWTANGNHGTVLGATYSSDIPLYNCNNVGISELNSNQTKELIKIVNLLGQEVEYTPNSVLIYQYSDGTSEKVFTIEK